MKSTAYRNESDAFGSAAIASGSLSGIHTLRAKQNFPLTQRMPHPALIHAYGHVKLAALQTNHAVGVWQDNPEKVLAMTQACELMIKGMLDQHIEVDALQGGAGTSLNMNVNEVLANQALIIMGSAPGNYALISPHEDLNCHQSTNDTFPSALKLAAIQLLKNLENRVSLLVEAFQKKEQALSAVVKMGRSQFQDAVPTSLGRSMSAYAEAFGRDRWRLYKCEERLRVLNLGGTAIGTGLGAPRQYIFSVVDTLRANTGIGFARAENLIDNTQNADVYVEVSGILKALASNLIKCCSDLRLMSSGPDCGLAEISLPALQAGSSLMPQKVNPVIPEAVTQGAIRFLGYDHEITFAASLGSLELNPFLPLIADALLHGIDLLTQAVELLRSKCVEGLSANTENLAQACEHATAVATALVPALGYRRVSELMAEAKTKKLSIKTLVLQKKLFSEERFNAMMSAEALTRLGH